MGNLVASWPNRAESGVSFLIQSIITHMHTINHVQEMGQPVPETDEDRDTAFKAVAELEALGETAQLVYFINALYLQICVASFPCKPLRQWLSWRC